jgi:transposase
LILDNARVHGGADTFDFLLEILGNAGVELMYLPAYSPELNPIELVFASIKQYLRSCCQPEIPLFFEIMALFSTITIDELLPLYNKCLSLH